MSRSDERNPTLPPRIQAAFDFLDHARKVTETYDVSIPTRPLTSLEKSVETAALKVLQQYLLGEMDFGDTPPEATPRPGDDDDTAGEVVESPR